MPLVTGDADWTSREVVRLRTEEDKDDLGGRAEAESLVSDRLERAMSNLGGEATPVDDPDADERSMGDGSSRMLIQGRMWYSRARSAAAK